MKKKKLSLLENYIFREKKETFLFGGKKKKNRENFLVAHDSSAKYASIFFSLFLLSLVESPPLESHDQAVPYFFYTRLPSSPPPFIFRFQRLFPSFLSLSLFPSLSFSKRG